MKKIIFVPFSVGLSLVAGMASKPIIARVWSIFDDEDPPESSHRQASWAKVLAAAAVQGAIFRMTRTAADRGFRRAFLSVTGSWPGDTRPDPR